MTQNAHDIVFWQNTISLHQGPLVRELGYLGLSVLVVTQDGLSEARRSMGWGQADFGTADVVTSPSAAALNQLVQELGPETTHVFSGLDAYPMVAAARRLVRRRPHGQVLISTEPFDTRGLSGLARHARFFWRSHRLTGVDTVLTIGRQAREQFNRLLPSTVRKAEFGYFVESRTRTFETTQPVTGPVHVVFVGELIDLKRPELLLEALLAIPHNTWRLTVIGDGPLRDAVSRSASQARHADVSLLGTVPNTAVADVLVTADLLVLPSAYDGWGAVINEALSVGTPVLVSSAAGSCDLVSTPLAGRVFAAQSRADFRRQLAAALDAGRVSPEARRDLAAWAREKTSARAAASYLAELIRDPQAEIAPPWRNAVTNRGDES
ncbi:glycosyltransferase [Frigoribacterium sp. VKM Ac-2530]|uniref:glycosyltransferase n=1 Tax=Frigoribacterium sp. VKM Ac-2530 TaxID=2783822 RepID=UPI00188AC673|nr:glycosyltransferase [Frigoribacterium sp. VKM Ac-2530]MBF4578673.1 glycosyltransferase [Frigoribacterium sp. VKM Ac-2530]